LDDTCDYMELKDGDKIYLIMERPHIVETYSKFCTKCMNYVDNVMKCSKGCNVCRKCIKKYIDINSDHLDMQRFKNWKCSVNKCNKVKEDNNAICNGTFTGIYDKMDLLSNICLKVVLDNEEKKPIPLYFPDLFLKYKYRHKSVKRSRELKK